MKRLIIILCLVPSIIVNSQTIDWSNFSENTTNDVVFNEMNDYIFPDGIVSLHRNSIDQEKIYRFIKRKNERILLDDLDVAVNEILAKYDSPFVKEANMVGNIGIIDSILCKDVRTYQDIANRCISDWENSGSMILLLGSQIAEAITYYNQKTQTIYIFFASLR